MRYSLLTQGGDYLMASYEPTGSGVVLTPNEEDACSYVTMEKAAQVCKELRANGIITNILVVEE